MMARESELSEKGHDNPPHLLDERFYVHANQPRTMGAIPNAEGTATGVGVCGDSIEISIPNADCGREVGILRFSAFTQEK
jgi:hypothetical protein